MSKINIPTCTLLDTECDILFQSVVDKLNIQNPRFHYPIYNKIINNASDSRGLIFDSKFKVREILSKVLENDSDEYETDDDVDSCDVVDNTILDKSNYTFNLEASTNKQESNTDVLLENNALETVLNTDQDVELFKIHNSNSKISDDVSVKSSNDEHVIEEAINNVFSATAKIERVNKATGEKFIKDEQIHIKKSPLLEPLKILKDEFLIPARLKNQSLVDDILHRTRAKLNSYNNSAHVEALFLYLGNKLVESGNCPSFPYYYGCINGEDPNYHHDITDEYDMVSRTRWFRNRVKTDFDLLILEGDEMDEAEKEMIEKMHRPQSHNRFQDNNDLESDSQSGGSKDEDEVENEDNNNASDDFKAYKKYISKSIGLEDNSDGDNEDEDEDIEKALEFLSKNDNNSNGDNSGDNKEINNIEKSENIIPIDEIDSTLNNILTDMEDRANTSKSNNTDFIKNINSLDDLELDIQFDNDNDNLEGSTKAIPAVEPVIVSENHLDDNLIEVLSDIDKDELTMSDFEDNSINNQYYLKCAQIPVSLCMMEKLDQTLDNLLDDGYNMSDVEWFSVFFQVAFGLAIAQKYFNFVHNDLHSSNVMFKTTELRNLFFQIGNIYYRVPTFGKITKIIDFARGTFKLGDRWIFSDQFKEDGDAWGQYDYPSDGTLANCVHKPNPSFDMVRLGTTIIQRLDDVPTVRHFIEEITKDDYDNSLCYEEDTFQLYIDIAHNAHNAIPIEVLAHPEFERFKVARDRVPKGAYVFKY